MKTKEELFEDIMKKATAEMCLDMPMTDESIGAIVDIYTVGLQRGINSCTDAVMKMFLYKATNDILNRGCENQ